jgi:hypothetical protein
MGIIEYKIITAYGGYPADLERKVNAAIAEGWQPCGGICATTHQGSGTVSYYQAMTRGLLALFPVEVMPVAKTETPPVKFEAADPVAFSVTPAPAKRGRKAKVAANAH